MSTIGKSTERIHDIVNILKTDRLVIRDWEQICGGLNIQDAAEMQQWRLRYSTGAMTSYALFFEMLSKWTSVRGSEANMETLVNILSTEGFLASAERLKEMFPAECSIVKPAPNATVDDPCRNVPIMSHTAPPRNLTPRDGKELEMTLAHCRDGDIIALARGTTYRGNFTINKNNITLVGGHSSAITCEDADVALYIFGDGCSVNGVNVTAERGTCILLAGNNNKLDDCSLTMNGSDGSIGLLLRGRNNQVEKLDIMMDSETVRILGALGLNFLSKPEFRKGEQNTSNGKIGLQIEGTDIACNRIIVRTGNWHRHYSSANPESAVTLLCTTLSERVCLQDCQFQCGPGGSNKVFGNAHSMQNVDFTASVELNNNDSPVRMKNCSAEELSILEGGKIDWVNCHFQHIPIGINTTGSAP